jgi:hypothetical protein
MGIVGYIQGLIAFLILGPRAKYAGRVNIADPDFTNLCEGYRHRRRRNVQPESLHVNHLIPFMF